MLLVLVCLEDDRSQSCITLNALWGADTAVFGTETAFEQIIHVILDTSRRFCRIIIQVMNMNVSQLVSFGKTLRQQVFISIIFGYFRCKRHHLSGRCMAAHIGVAYVYSFLVDSDNTIHDVLHLGFLVSFRIPPFTVDDVLFGDLRPYLLNAFSTKSWFPLR